MLYRRVHGYLTGNYGEGLFKKKKMFMASGWVKGNETDCEIRIVMQQR